MTLILGLILIPLVLLIIKKTTLVKTKKRTKIILNILLILITIIYIIVCFALNLEPFDFTGEYSPYYMIYNGDFLLMSGVIFVFEPFMWIILIHFLKMIFRSIRVRKNAIIKKDEEFIYYRGDLDKVSPSLIMFVSKFDLDIKKSISATILKLKLTGYIKEYNDSYIYTEKDPSNLLESEKMVLDFLKFNVFNKNKYKKVIEQEALNNKYIAKNRGGIPFRILKIIISICVPIFIYVFSVQLDDYVFYNYHIFQHDDGYAYIKLTREKDIENLYKEVTDINDYYHREIFDGSLVYSYNSIRADKLEYSVVMKSFILHLFNTLIIGFFAAFVLISLYIITEQIIYFNKNYRITIKGKALLNKAYALKNYLKEYSLIKDRTEEELALWEYYLVYAVVLDVNVVIEDKIIQKYLQNYYLNNSVSEF